MVTRGAALPPPPPFPGSPRPRVRVPPPPLPAPAVGFPLWTPPKLPHGSSVRVWGLWGAAGPGVWGGVALGTALLGVWGLGLGWGRSMGGASPQRQGICAPGSFRFLQVPLGSSRFLRALHVCSLWCFDIQAQLSGEAAPGGGRGLVSQLGVIGVDAKPGRK